MYLKIKIGIIALIMVARVYHAIAQNNNVNPNSLEVGLNVAGNEALFYGGHGKFIIPLSNRKHHPTFGIGLTSYFDFKGESESKAYLKNAIAMRMIPAIHFGYALNYNRFQFNFEVPIGASIAITKGTLINERVGFQRKYSNSELFWHYGIAVSPKFKINRKNQVGLNVFLPLVPDKAASGYIFGIGWTRKLSSASDSF